ncbi:MAG: metallophosphoesterase [Limnochordia bacterium]
MLSYVWISSDLQLEDPEVARSVLMQAIDDVQQLNLPLVGAWCLGDVLVGSKLPALEETAKAVVGLYEQLGVPMRYVMGNHEKDYCRIRGEGRFPFHEQVRDRAGWVTTSSPRDFYFSEPWCGHQVFFFSDQADPSGEWIATHHKRPEQWPEGYPNRQELWQAVRREMAASSLPVISVCHYAFPGGQRPSSVLEQLLPLPDTVRCHLYGHAHIGDLVWNKACPWERQHCVAGHDIMQYNISALESLRSPGSHSAFLEFRPTGALQLRIRCHLERRWVACYDIQA